MTKRARTDVSGDVSGDACDGDGNVVLSVNMDKLRCPIGLSLLVNPVITSDGSCFELKNIVEWVNSGKTISPCTRLPIKTQGRWYFENIFVRNLVVEYMAKAHMDVPMDERSEWILERQRYLFEKDQHTSALEYGPYDPSTVEILFEVWDYEDEVPSNMKKEIVDMLKDPKREEALRLENSLCYIKATLILLHVAPSTSEPYVSQCVNQALTFCVRGHDRKHTLFHTRICAAVTLLRYQSKKRAETMELIDLGANLEKSTRGWYFMRTLQGVCMLFGLCGLTRNANLAESVLGEVVREQHTSSMVAEYWHAKIMLDPQHFDFHIEDDDESENTLHMQGLNELCRLADVVMRDDREGEQVDYVRKLMADDKINPRRKFEVEDLLFWHPHYFRFRVP